MPTWGEVSRDIEPYYYEAYWWTGAEWLPMIPSTEMVDGNDYFVNISQDCTLSWNSYYFNFVEGRNYFTWEPAISGWVQGDFALLTIQPSEPVGPGNWVLGDVATLSIQPSEPVGPGGWVKGAATTLTIQFTPNGPPEPEEKDWLDWIEEHALGLSLVGLGTAGVILAWPKGGKK